MKRWLKDPVTSFVIAGTAIFVLSGMFADSEISSVVELTDSDVQRLTGVWRMQKNREPSPDDLVDIVDNFVKDEIYFRESKRLGLDVNDSIVRRRLVQKLTFLTEDIASIQPLDETALRTFYDENRADYAVPKRFTFSHRYFSHERRVNAQSDAVKALNIEDEGDAFMLQMDYRQQSLGQIRNFLGDEFAKSLDQLSANAEKWQGPVKSSYGWHIVRLDEVEESFIPDYAAVAKRVSSDATVALRGSANQAYYEELKSRYQVIYPDSLTLQN